MARKGMLFFKFIIVIILWLSVFFLLKLISNNTIYVLVIYWLNLALLVWNLLMVYINHKHRYTKYKTKN